MSGVFIPLIGRFGNACLQYCYARAYAEQNGLELHTPRWIGEKIFQIEPTPEKQPDDYEIPGYRQNQDSMIYTRKQAREWFKFRPEIEEELRLFGGNAMICHLRRGDYEGFGYPTVSVQSYIEAIDKFDCHCYPTNWVSEDKPTRIPKLDELGMSFLMDFYKMMVAPVLFRANSSFSFFAAVLADPSQLIFSPIVKHLPAGEHDCEFVAGNWPALSSRGDCTDMHML